MAPTGLEVVGRNAPLLLDGLQVTLGVAAVSVALGVAGGLLVGAVRLSPAPVVRFAAWLHLEAFRVIPLIVWLFLAFFAVPIAFGLPVSGALAAIVVFSLWAAAEMGDLVRGALASIPRAQFDGGRAIGLSTGQLYRQVILPQAVRRLLPGTINLVTRIIKSTSLVVLVGVVDVVKRGQQIIERTQEPLAIYLALMVVFFVLCFPLSLLSRRLERRWAA